MDSLEHAIHSISLNTTSDSSLSQDLAVSAIAAIGHGMPIWQLFAAWDKEQELAQGGQTLARTCNTGAFRLTCRALRSLSNLLITDLPALRLGFEQLGDSDTMTYCESKQHWSAGQLIQHKTAQAFIPELVHLKSVKVMLDAGGMSQLSDLCKCFTSRVKSLSVDHSKDLRLLKCTRGFSEAGSGLQSALAYHLPQLHHLNLNLPVEIDLARLAGLTSLHSLTVTSDKFTNLASLSSLTSLTKLSFELIQKPKGLGKQLGCVQPLVPLAHQLKHLELTGPALSDLDHIAALTSLTSIHLSSRSGSVLAGNQPNPEVNVQRLLPLASCLKSLQLDQIRLRNAQHLSSLSSLSTLHLTATGPIHLEHLSSLGGSLQDLSLWDVAVTGSDHILALTRLTSLAVQPHSEQEWAGHVLLGILHGLMPLGELSRLEMPTYPIVFIGGFEQLASITHLHVMSCTISTQLEGHTCLPALRSLVLGCEPAEVHDLHAILQAAPNLQHIQHSTELRFECARDPKILSQTLEALIKMEGHYLRKGTAVLRVGGYGMPGAQLMAALSPLNTLTRPKLTLKMAGMTAAGAKALAESVPRLVQLELMLIRPMAPEVAMHLAYMPCLRSIREIGPRG